jgi:alpha-beta hydrolase superfamily lysophospholipase
MLIASVSFSLLTLACAAPDEFRARTDDNVTIAAEILRPSSVTRRPTLVLLSGASPYTRDYSTATGTTTDGGYRDLARRLCAAGFSVVLFDERGAGESTGDYWATATTSRLAEDVVTLLGAVPATADQTARQFILLGHSEGGTIATIVATMSPAVVGVVTLGAPATDLAAVMEFQLANAQRLDYVYGPLLAEHQRRSAHELWYRTALTFDPLASARQVCVPTLVLHGTLDESVPVAHAAMLGASICAGRAGIATVHALAGHDHSLVRRCEGDVLSPETLAILFTWLERHFERDIAPQQSAH